MDLLTSFGMLPLITEPTRVTPTSSTGIDNITVDETADFISSGVIKSTPSDGKTIHINR